MEAPVQSSTGNDASYVNYLDIKLERVEGIPPDWFAEEKESSPQLFAQHPFRYEVALQLPAASRQHEPSASFEAPREGGPAADAPAQTAESPRDTVASFLHGRLLAPLQMYKDYIDAAAPTPVAGVDTASPLQDVPEMLEPPVSLEAATGSSENAADGSAAAAVATVCPADVAAAAAAPPVILWIATERVEAAGTGALLPTPAATTANSSAAAGAASTSAGERKAKRKAAAGGGSAAARDSVVSSSAAATAAADGAAAALPLPAKNESPPCVVRVPLDASRLALLEDLLARQQPLELSFRRVLRPGVPADWEDLNAGYYQATLPVSLAGFAVPGSLHLQAAVPLQPLCTPNAPPPQQQQQQQQQQSGTDHDRAKKKLAARRNKSGMPARLYEDPDPLSPHPYLAAGTTAVLSLRLQRTLTRLTVDRVRPAVTPQQLIPSRSRTAPAAQQQQQPTPSVAANALVSEALEDIARKVLRDYKNSCEASLPTAASTRAEKEAWRASFLEFFQSSGQLAAYTSQLTPLVARLVQEGRLRVARDAPLEKTRQASNELYVYLLETMHATLKRLVDAEVGSTRSAEDCVSLEGGGEEENSESCACSAWRQRAVEAEASRDVALAATYHQARIQCACECAAVENTGAPGACSLVVVWTEAAYFYVRQGDAVRAEQCYREAIACDPLHVPALLGYGMLLMAYNRLSEAAVFLHGAADTAPQCALVWAVVALLDDLFLLDLKEGSPLYAPEKAKWTREHRHAVQQAAVLLRGERRRESASSTPGPATAAEAGDGSLPATAAEEEAVCLFSARYATELHHHDLANVSLARCAAGSTEVEQLYVRIFTQGGQYREALDTLAGMAETDGNASSGSITDACRAQRQDELQLYAAQCEEALGSAEKAIHLYKSVLCRPVDGASAPPSYLTQSSGAAAAAASMSFDPHVPVGAAHGGPVSLQPATTDAHYAASRQRLLGGCGYLRLGNLLLATGRFKDALGAFTLGLQVWSRCSVLWLGAGIAYHRMGGPNAPAAVLAAAEECLCESNCISPVNPRTWAYLALHQLASSTGCTDATPTAPPTLLTLSVQQAMLHGLTDAALWVELGRELLLSTPTHPALSEVCLRHALDALGEEEKTSAAAVLEGPRHTAAVAPTSSSLLLLLPGEETPAHRRQQLAVVCTYHLAHALEGMRRWSEAREVLERVACNRYHAVLRAKAADELRELPDQI